VCRDEKRSIGGIDAQPVDMDRARISRLIGAWRLRPLLTAAKQSRREETYQPPKSP
jgi:hypothetical protein